MEGNKHDVLRALIDNVHHDGPIVETCGLTVATLFPVDPKLALWYEAFVAKLRAEDWFVGTPSYVYPSAALHCTVATLLDFVLMHGKPPIDVPAFAAMWHDALRNALAASPVFGPHLAPQDPNSPSVTTLTGLNPMYFRMSRPRLTSNCAILEFVEEGADPSVWAFRDVIKSAFQGQIAAFYDSELGGVEGNHFRVPTIIHTTFVRVFDDLSEAQAQRFRAGFADLVEREWPSEGLLIGPVTSFHLAHEWTPFMHMIHLDASRPFSLASFEIK